MLECVRGRDRHLERPGVGVADVLGGEDHHPADDEARVLAALEHRREVVDGRIGVGAAHRLDEGRDEVIVLVGALVVAERPLARRVVDVTLLEWDALGLGGLPGQLHRAQRRPRVAAGAAGDQLDELAGTSAPIAAAPRRTTSPSSSSESDCSSTTWQRESRAELTSK